MVMTIGDGANFSDSSCADTRRLQGYDGRALTTSTTILTDVTVELAQAIAYGVVSVDEYVISKLGNNGSQTLEDNIVYHANRLAGSGGVTMAAIAVTDIIVDTFSPTAAPTPAPTPTPTSPPTPVPTALPSPLPSEVPETPFPTPGPTILRDLALDATAILVLTVRSGADAAEFGHEEINALRSAIASSVESISAPQKVHVKSILNRNATRAIGDEWQWEDGRYVQYVEDVAPTLGNLSDVTCENSTNTSANASSTSANASIIACSTRNITFVPKPNTVIVNFTLERLVVYDVYKPELGARFFSDVLYSQLEQALNSHPSTNSSFVYHLRLEADARGSSVLQNATLDTTATTDWLQLAWSSVLYCEALIWSMRQLLVVVMQQEPDVPHPLEGTVHRFRVRSLRHPPHLRPWASPECRQRRLLHLPARPRWLSPGRSPAPRRPAPRRERQAVLLAEREVVLAVVAAVAAVAGVAVWGISSRCSSKYNSSPSPRSSMFQ